MELMERNEQKKEKRREKERERRVAKQQQRSLEEDVDEDDKSADKRGATSMMEYLAENSLTHFKKVTLTLRPPTASIPRSTTLDHS